MLEAFNDALRVKQAKPWDRIKEQAAERRGFSGVLDTYERGRAFGAGQNLRTLETWIEGPANYLQSRLSYKAYLVYRTLVRGISAKTGNCQLRLTEVSARSGVCIATCRAIVNGLEEAGLLEKKRTVAGNAYCLRATGNLQHDTSKEIDFNVDVRRPQFTPAGGVWRGSERRTRRESSSAPCAI
jgi:hypothetical protein